MQLKKNIFSIFVFIISQFNILYSGELNQTSTDHGFSLSYQKAVAALDSLQGQKITRVKIDTACYIQLRSSKPATDEFQLEENTPAINVKTVILNTSLSSFLTALHHSGTVNDKTLPAGNKSSISVKNAEINVHAAIPTSQSIPDHATINDFQEDIILVASPEEQIPNLPCWLKNWNLLNFSVSSTDDVKYDFYFQCFQDGKVLLGVNPQISRNKVYILLSNARKYYNISQNEHLELDYQLDWSVETMQNNITQKVKLEHISFRAER